MIRIAGNPDVEVLLGFDGDAEFGEVHRIRE
jgi:hypothetical protein